MRHVMKKQPIGIFVRPYRGQDDEKRRRFEEEVRVARLLESYLNGKMTDAEDQVLEYADIAKELRVDREIVAKHLFALRGGNFRILI